MGHTAGGSSRGFVMCTLQHSISKNLKSQLGSHIWRYESTTKSPPPFGFGLGEFSRIVALDTTSSNKPSPESSTSIRLSHNKNPSRVNGSMDKNKRCLSPAVGSRDICRHGKPALIWDKLNAVLLAVISMIRLWQITEVLRHDAGR